MTKRVGKEVGQKEMIGFINNAVASCLNCAKNHRLIHVPNVEFRLSGRGQEIRAAIIKLIRASKEEKA